MFHIVLSSDSLSLPRPWLKSRPSDEPNKFTRFIETYPLLLEALLSQRFPATQFKVTNWATRASGIGAVVKQKIDLFSWLEPDLTIVHRGVVDCWPREHKAWQANTSPEEFRAFCSELVEARNELNPDLPLFFIGICPPNEHAISKMPSVVENVYRYNSEMKSVLGPLVHYMDMEELHRRQGDSILHPDGHHLSKIGHFVLAEALADSISERFVNDPRFAAADSRTHGSANGHTERDAAKGRQDAPIVLLSSEEAVSNRKTNPASSWPTRSDSDNRVEPITQPVFAVPFKLIPGERIFTIGSCFARNIEQELEERGFEVPVRQLLKRADLNLSTDGLLNNYGVTSILQELQRAFDPDHSCAPEKSFVEVPSGNFIDLNMPAGLRPEPLEIVQRRHQAIVECTKSISSCRVIIITLGLAEVWYDTQAGVYVNETPRPSLVRAQPDRFELHVLSYPYLYECLRKAMEIIHANGPEGVQVLLTVSPVPLTATHRDCDVIVANTYSKSVLRAVTEEIVSEFDFVHYYPSYESVIHSDRSIAWKEDQIHVTSELVKSNVMRMIKAFGPEAQQQNDPEAVLEKFRTLRSQGIRPQWNYLNENRDVIREHKVLAYEFARLAVNRNDPEGARWAIESLPVMEPPFQREILEAELHLAEGRPGEALTLMDIVDGAGPRSATFAIRRELYRIRTLANLDRSDRENAISSALSWARQAAGTDFKTPLLVLARGFMARSQYADARHFFATVAETYEENVSVMLQYAECLIQTGALDDAARILGRLNPDTPGERRRRDELLVFLPRQASGTNA